MKLQKIEKGLPLLAALIVLVGVGGAAEDALADDVAPVAPVSAEVEISR